MSNEYFIEVDIRVISKVTDLITYTKRLSIIVQDFDGKFVSIYEVIRAFNKIVIIDE